MDTHGLSGNGRFDYYMKMNQFTILTKGRRKIISIVKEKNEQYLIPFIF